MQAIDIFKYIDYRDYLRDWAVEEKKRRSGFSIRSFSKRIGISDSYFHLVARKSRRMRREIVERVSEYLKLSQDESTYLFLLRDLVDANNERDRAQAFERIQDFRRFLKLESDTVQVHEYLSHWYYVAIRELASIKDFKCDPQWIKERLWPRLSLIEIQNALDFLTERKYIVRRPDGRAHLDRKRIRCEGGSYRFALKNIHREMLGLIDQSLDEVQTFERCVRGQMIAVDKAKQKRIFLLIKRTQERIAEIAMEEARGEERSEEEVIYVSLCSVPISRGAK